MRKFVVVGLTALALGLLTSDSAQAFGRRHKHDCCECAPACADSCAAPCYTTKVEYVEKKVTAYRPVTKQREVVYTVNKIVPKEVVSEVKYVVNVPEYKTEARQVTVMTAKPVVVEREVPVCTVVRETCVDACGCCHVVCRPVTTLVKQSCTVMQCVPETRTVNVQVCSWKQETRTQQVKRIVCETVAEQVKSVVSYCELEQYETTVKVAVCTVVPVAPAPCAVPVCCN